jgi:hypothetical protein
MKLTVTGLLVVGLLGSSNAAPHSAHDAARAIDSILEQTWAERQASGNPAADDATFLRRIYLDTIGRIPTSRETELFMSNSDPEKRAKLIDELLASEGYVQHFFNYWADVLRAQSNGGQAGPITGAAYVMHLKEALRKNTPYDQFVRELVAAQGRAWDNGAIGYYMRDRGMALDNMANTARIFLGTRMECAQCHNHPFDKWTQMQFYQMAAFTFGVETQDYYGSMSGVTEHLREEEAVLRASFKEPEKPRRPDQPKNNSKYSKDQWQAMQRDYAAKQKAYAAALKRWETDVKDVNRKRDAARQELRKEQRNYQEAITDVRNTMRYTSVGQRDRKLTLPQDYQYDDAKPRSTVAPAPMMGHAVHVLPGETQLDAYARWMTSKENPRFNKVIVNRLWKKAFGLALIEPLDELMDTTVSMNPALQQHLEALIMEVNYDMKHFLRILFNTETYQRQATRREHAPGETYLFTGPLLRRMTAEQMWDSFVTLINPNPDMPNQVVRDAMSERITQAKKNADGIDSLTLEEALRGVKLTAEVYAKNRERTEGKQKQYAEARGEAKEAMDKALLMKEGPERDKAVADAKALRTKADQIRSEVNAIQNEGRRMAMSEIVIPGQKKLYEKVTGKPYGSPVVAAAEGDAPAMMANGESMMMMSYGGKTDRVLIPGYDKAELTEAQRKAESQRRDAQFAEEAAFFGIGEKEHRSYFKVRQDQIKTWMRSAEIESPAPRGHYLREFGQSDRETIENANLEASVPQALAMMNGLLMPAILNKYSQLMLTVNKAPYPDDKIDAIYTAVLSRKPTAQEKEVWLQAQDKGLTGLDDLIFALLNTQQFIFIQ